MNMLVLLVVNVAMRVIENFMCVALDVALGEIESGAQCQQQTGDHEDRHLCQDRRRHNSSGHHRGRGPSAAPCKSLLIPSTAAGVTIGLAVMYAIALLVLTAGSSRFDLRT